MLDLHYDNLWSSEVCDNNNQNHWCRINSQKQYSVSPSFSLMHVREQSSIQPTRSWAMPVDQLRLDLSHSSFYRYVRSLEIWSNPIMGHMWETLCHEDIMIWCIHMTFLSNQIAGSMANTVFIFSLAEW
jgi:hypothetical protein